MRLTALCVCGTLLAFSSLSWTTVDSDEADLLGFDGFGPCTATLRLEGPCRQGEDESTCPYLFSLPPLTVSLPKQFSELEKILEDLQTLKDNVDQLRRMCADCTVSQTERECGRQSEREHEKLNEKGSERHEDERNSLNERNPERLKEFSQECGTDRLKAGKSMKGDGDSDSGKRTTLEGRKKWGAERESSKGVVKENENEETLREVADKDGKNQTKEAKRKSELEQAKVSMYGGNERIVDIVIKKVGEKNNRERGADRNKEKDGEGISKGDREDMLENGKQSGITSNIKKKEKKEESDHHVWRDKTEEAERNTQTEEDGGSDGIKMSEDHDKHTNKEREKNREERKKETEKGIKVDQNNEKKTESIGRAEKEMAIKEGEEEEEEEREMGKKIKTGEKSVQSVQRDSGEDLSSSKAIERTDFVSIRPTPHTTFSLTPRHDIMDSNEAKTFTSPLPSPSVSSSTSNVLTGVDQGMTTTADGLPTHNTGLRAAGISELPRPDADAGIRAASRSTTATTSSLGGPGQQIASTTARFTSTTSTSPGGGIQGQVISNMATTTATYPHQNLYTTTFPGVVDHSRWTAKKNMSSNTKTGVKPLPGRGLMPNENNKPAIKPEVDRRHKNPKNDRKLDRAPLPDKKTKPDQKQRPSHQKPPTDQKSKPDRDPKRVQISKLDQRPQTDNLTTDQNFNNIQIPKQDQERTTDQSQSPIQKPNSHKKSLTPAQRPTSHQRPQIVNATGTGKDTQTDKEPESVVTIINPNLKPDKKPIHPIKADRSDQKQIPHKKPKSEEKPKHRSESTSLTPIPDQNPATELTENPDKNSSPEPKSAQDSNPVQNRTPDRPLINPTDRNSIQRPKLDQEHTTAPNQLPSQNQKPKPPQKSTLPVQRPTSHRRPQTVNTTGSDKDHQTDKETESVFPNTDRNLKPENKPFHPSTTDKSGQKQIPYKKPKSEDRAKPDQRPTSNQYFPSVQEPEPERRKTASITPTPDQTPEPESVQESPPGQKLTPHRTPIKPSDQNKIQIPKQDQERTTDQNQLPIQKPKFPQKGKLPLQRPTSHQRPPAVNATGSDKDHRTDKETESVVPNTDQNLKPGNKPFHPSTTDKSGQKQIPYKKPKSEDRAKPDQRPTSNQYFPSVQKPELDRSKTASITPRPDQTPELESVQESPPGQKLTPDRTPIKPSDQNKIQIPKQDQTNTIDQNHSPIPKPKSPQKGKLPLQRPTSHQRPPAVNATGSDRDHQTDQDSESDVPIIKHNLKPGRNHLHPSKTDKSDQKQIPHKQPKSEDTTKPDQRQTSIFQQYFQPVQEPEPERSETASVTSKPDQTPEPESVQESPPGQKLTPHRVPDRNNIQIPKQDQGHTTAQNQLPIQKPTSPQRPQAVNATGSDKDPRTDQERDSVVPNIDQNVKSESKPLNPLKTDKTDQKQKPHIKQKSDEKPKPDLKSTLNQNFPPVEEPEPGSSETASLSPKPDQSHVTKLMENPDDTLSPEPKSVQDSSTAQTLSPDHAIIKYSDQNNIQIPKKDQEHTTDQNQSPVQKPKLPIQRPTSHQKPQKTNTTGSDIDIRTDQTSEFDEIPVTINKNSKTEKKTLHPASSDKTDQKQIPHRKLKIEDKTKPDRGLTLNEDLPNVQEPEPERSETDTLTPLPNQNPVTKSMENPDKPPSPEPKSEQDQSHGQKPTPDSTLINPPDQNRSRIPEHDHEHTSDQSQLPIQKPKSPFQRPISQPRPPTVNTTGSDKDHPTDQEFESTGIPINNHDLKPENKPLHPSETEKSDLKQIHHKKPTSDDKTKLDQGSTSKQNFPLVQEPEPEKSKTASLTPKPDQGHVTELLENPDKNTSPEPKSVQDPSPGQSLTPNHTLISSPNQKFTPIQKIPKINQKPKPGQTPKFNQKHPVPTTGQKTKPNVKPKPEQTPLTNQELETPQPDQIPNLNPKSVPAEIPGAESNKTSQSRQPTRPTIKPSVLEPELERSETASLTPKPNQNPVTELIENTNKKPSSGTKSIQDPSRGQKLIPDHVPIKPSDRKPKPGQKIPKTDQKPKPGQTPKLNLKHPDLSTGQKTKPNVKSDPGQKSQTNQGTKTPQPDQIPDLNPKYVPDEIHGAESNKTSKLKHQKHSDPATSNKMKPHVRPKPDQTPQANQGFKTPHPDQILDLNSKSVPDDIPEAETNKTSRLRPPTRPTVRPGATSIKRPKPSLQLRPSPKTKTDSEPPQITRTTSHGVQNSQTDMPPASGPVKQTADVTHSPGDTEFNPSVMKTITLGPKTFNSLKTGPFPRPNTLPEGFTMSPNSRITSDLRPQTASQPPSIPMTTRLNKIMRGSLPSVIPSTSPGSTKSNQAPNTDSRLQAKIHHNVGGTAPKQSPKLDKMSPVPSTDAHSTSTTSPDLRSTSSASSGPEPLAPEASTPSARELRQKINQVAAFFNNSLSPNGRLPDGPTTESPEDSQGGSRPDRRDSKPPTLPSKAAMVKRDCSDYLLRGQTKSGVYLVTPDIRSRSFPVYCDMELDGGGWTVVQRRQDGSVSFNRTWAEYRSGFGELDGGEFWLGNSIIHLLTRDRDMALRVELEDFDGTMAFAMYEHFRVASERMRYRLSVGGYSGTAGDALRFSKSYDHNNRAFTTPDRDHDRYPSGNCGAYYSSGWWFDACMAANLNGRYYIGKYKGVRDGIFWGTWRNISTEYYPTNDRQSFKAVKMMIRPKGFKA